MMNSKIPKGRTMIKWRAFAALPEQFIGINKLIEEQTKIKRPILTPEEQEIIEKKSLTLTHQNQKYYLHILKMVGCLHAI